MLAAHRSKRFRNKLSLRPLAAPRLAYPPATAPHAVGMSSAPGTLAPPCAYGFRFGTVYPVSKALKFLKLFGQRLRTET